MDIDANDRIVFPTTDTPFSLGIEEILDFIRTRRDQIEQPIPAEYAQAYALAEKAVEVLTVHPTYIEERFKWACVPAEEWFQRNGHGHRNTEKPVT